MEQFRCIKKCYYNERRWHPDEVLQFNPGGLDPNGKPMRTPAQAGVGHCFEQVTAAQAVDALARREETIRLEKSPTTRRPKPPMPIDFREEFDTHG